MVPNYWAVQPTLEEAWKAIKLIGGSHIRKGGAHFALQFPARVKIEVDVVNGHWQATKKPIKLVSHRGLTEESVDSLKQSIKRGKS